MQVSYSSLQGIALLLMLGYTMYDLVFDAKLGIIARTLYRAMPDLAHYSVMAMLLVTGITMASHITLGPMLPAFDTFSGGSSLLLLPKCSCCQCATSTCALSFARLSAEVSHGTTFACHL
jgi:hypothetical protein